MQSNKSKIPAISLLILGVAITAGHWGVRGALAAPGQDSGATDKAAEKNSHPFLDKAIKAIGGETRLAKLRAGSCRGKLTGKVDGQELSVDGKVFWQGLDRSRIELAARVGGQDVRFLVVLNGDKAYFRENDKSSDLPAEAGPFVKEMMYCMRLPQLLPLLKEKGFKLTPVEETMVDNRPAVGLWIVHEDHKDSGLYFDKESGLPVRSEIRLNDPQGKEVNFEFVYSDYKEVAGVKHPTKLKIKGPQEIGELELELSEIKFAEKLEDKLFEKP